MILEHGVGGGSLQPDIPGNREIAAVPVPNRMLMTFSGTGLLGLARNEFRSLVAQESDGTLSKVADLAYHHPDLVNVRNSQHEQLQSSMAFIRATFPSVSGFFEDSDLKSTLSKFPSVQQAVNQEHQALQDIGQAGQVRLADLILRRLIQSATSITGSPQDYERIVSAHTLYGELAKQIFGSTLVIPDKKEESAFTQIGQLLLKTRRLFEASEEGVTDSTGSLIRFKDRGKDYEGTLARIVTRNRMIAALEGSGEARNSDRLATLRHAAQDDITYILMQHPDKMRDARQVLGKTEGQNVLDPWVEIPGGPDFSRAESTSSLNNE